MIVRAPGPLVLISVPQLGFRVEKGKDLFMFIDLSTIFVLADVRSTDIPFIRTGLAAKAIIPAFAADYFGTKWVGSIYGLMLTAWGFAGVFGPLLIANIRQATGSYTGALITIACILLVASLLPAVLRRQPAAEEVAHAKPVGRV